MYAYIPGYACYSISEKSIPRFPYLGQLIEASGIIPKGPNIILPYDGGILSCSLCRPRISLGPSGIIVENHVRDQLRIHNESEA